MEKPTMNTPITRDIITDLLPVYLSGEASPDTKALVESYMKTDPEFAQLIKTEAKVILPNNLPNPAKEQELKALHETKRRIRHRSWHMFFAIFFTVFALSFRFDQEGMHWTWQLSPMLCSTLGALGIAFWILYFTAHGRLRKTGL
jgi:hypothetical protein